MQSFPTVVGKANRVPDRLTIGSQRKSNRVSFPNVNACVVYENRQTMIDSEVTSGHDETFSPVRGAWLIHNQLIRNPS